MNHLAVNGVHRLEGTANTRLHDRGSLIPYEPGQGFPPPLAVAADVDANASDVLARFLALEYRS